MKKNYKMRAGDIILEKSNSWFVNKIKKWYKIPEVNYSLVVEIEGKTLLCKTNVFNKLSITSTRELSNNSKVLVPKKDYNKIERSEFSKLILNLIEADAVITDSASLLDIVVNTIRPATIVDNNIKSLCRYYTHIANKSRRLIKR